VHASNHTWELGGQNVTWLGHGVVEFDIQVPPNITLLGAAYWTHPLVAASEVVADVEIRGCQDAFPWSLLPYTGGGGGVGTGDNAAAGGLCQAPPPGTYHVRWTLQAGAVDGRVCVLAVPNADATWGSCDFGPFANVVA